MTGSGGGGGVRRDQLRVDPDGQFPIDIPFVRMLGVRLIEFGDGVARMGLAVRADLQNSFAMAHGGVVMTLLDISMAVAARAVEPAPDDDLTKGMITIEMKTSFLRPGRGELRCLGRCIHRTRALAFCEGEILDETGAMVARASGTFKYVKRRD